MQNQIRNILMKKKAKNKLKLFKKRYNRYRKKLLKKSLSQIMVVSKKDSYQQVISQKLNRKKLLK